MFLFRPCTSIGIILLIMSHHQSKLPFHQRAEPWVDKKMSQLLLHWLNEEVQLSQRVYHFEEFKDGYLLGEILYRFNQQMDFQDFSLDGSASTILKNFGLLEPTMRKIGVTFNSRIANEVVRGNEKVTKNLLYEMKVALENLRRNCGHTIPAALKGTRSDKVLNLIPSGNHAFERAKAKTFQIAVRNALENPNLIMMEKVTKKYTDKTDDYYRTISMGESLDQATVALNRTRAKDIYKSRRDHEGEFAEAWESINLEQWRKNQKTAHVRRELKQRVLAELDGRRTAQRAQTAAEAKAYTLSSMDGFDEHLRSMIISNDEDKLASPKFVRTIKVDSNNRKVANVLQR